MSAATLIDFSKLPPPGIIEPLDYETILADMRANLVSLDPAYTALVESDTGIKILEAVAYYVLLLRARINDAARAVMLASATGADLDQLAALFGVARKIITPANADALPPAAAIMEDDADFRARIVLSLSGLSTAGPANAYRYHALRVADVRDVSVESPAPGHVVVTVLSRTADGAAPAGTIAAVSKILNDEDVRPLTDKVTVLGAAIRPYEIKALLHTHAGPDPEVVIQSARDRAAAYAADMHRLGNAITLSGLYAALHVTGVQRVDLETPAANIAIAPGEAPHCTAITLTHAAPEQ